MFYSEDGREISAAALPSFFSDPLRDDGRPRDYSKPPDRPLH